MGPRRRRNPGLSYRTHGAKRLRRLRERETPEERSHRLEQERERSRQKRITERAAILSFLQRRNNAIQEEEYPEMPIEDIEELRPGNVENVADAIVDTKLEISDTAVQIIHKTENVRERGNVNKICKLKRSPDDSDRAQKTRPMVTLPVLNLDEIQVKIPRRSSPRRDQWQFSGPCCCKNLSDLPLSPEGSLPQHTPFRKPETSLSKLGPLSQTCNVQDTMNRNRHLGSTSPMLADVSLSMELQNVPISLEADPKPTENLPSISTIKSTCIPLTLKTKPESPLYAENLAPLCVEDTVPGRSTMESAHIPFTLKKEAEPTLLCVEELLTETSIKNALGPFNPEEEPGYASPLHESDPLPTSPRADSAHIPFIMKIGPEFAPVEPNFSERESIAIDPFPSCPKAETNHFPMTLNENLESLLASEEHQSFNKKNAQNSDIISPIKNNPLHKRDGNAENCQIPNAKIGSVTSVRKEHELPNLNSRLHSEENISYKNCNSALTTEETLQECSVMPKDSESGGPKIVNLIAVRSVHKALKMGVDMSIISQ